jgi:hypothetical protein
MIVIEGIQLFHHTQPAYNDHAQPDMTNEEDGIYTGPSTDGLIQSNTGEHLMLSMTDEEKGQGYIGTFNVIVSANQTGYRQ